jgi:hypothetical protein
MRLILSLGFGAVRPLDVRVVLLLGYHVVAFLGYCVERKTGFLVGPERGGLEFYLIHLANASL